MNRRKSIVGSSSGAFPLPDKKSRSPFAFRRGEGSRDGQHTQLPSTPPGRDTPSTGLDSITTPPDRGYTSSESRQREDVNAIPPIQEAPVTTNGTTADHEQVERTQVDVVSPQVQILLLQVSVSKSTDVSQSPKQIQRVIRNARKLLMR
jgi:hypothetical protein